MWSQLLNSRAWILIPSSSIIPCKNPGINLPEMERPKVQLKTLKNIR
jgi:hypothetical protein